MAAIGVFREEEIDGEPFHIYTFSSQTFSSGEAATDSGDNNLSLPQPLFFCPSTRRKLEMLKRKEIIKGYSSGDDDDNEEDLPFNTSPHFPNTPNEDQQVLQRLFDSFSIFTICKLPLAPLFWCNNKYPDDDNKSRATNYICKSCRNPATGGNSYYLCPTCGEMFHKECVEAPLQIKHPSFPFLSLQLYSCPYTIEPVWKCICCEYFLRGMFYHCPSYNLNMHPFCAMNPIPILIDHPKRHLHPLTFFPKQNSLPCNVCGVINPLFPTYVCARCVFVVHHDCIYSPYVIRISRHQHRISFTYSLPSGKLSCGVCRKKVENDCGAYSCNKCDDYFVHSRCALRRDLWDGEELEGVPEEPEIVVEPFETVADGIILHFSHGHHLKLQISSVYDDGKLCQACRLPIYEGDYYSCMDQCDFILHDECANYPLKIRHPLYRHPLTLKVDPTNLYKASTGSGRFYCSVCRRYSCGFIYEDCKRPVGGSKLDVRCASICEPFTYQGHEHPLFLALDPKEEEKATCQICEEDTDDRGHYSRKLNCIECNYILCFRCATLPYKARYKHDKHFLTFWKGKEASDGESGWCEVCESKIVYSRKGGFYSCDDCCTTLHVHCLLGKDPYMKLGQTINLYYEGVVQILGNNTMSRPFCHGRGCDVGRCPYRVVFQRMKKTFCSFSCALTSSW